MQIIAMLNQKGGAGKTTLATQLARGLALDGLNVILVDSDTQGSARDWAAASEGAGVVTVGIDRAKSLLTDTPRLSADVVVVDGAPQARDLAAAAVSIADLVLIPVQPSPYDIWAAEALVDLVRERQTLADGQPIARFVINRATPGTVLEREVGPALADFDIPVLDTVVHQRQAYARLAARGLTALDVRSEREAAAEVRALVDEVRSLLDIQTIDA